MDNKILNQSLNTVSNLINNNQILAAIEQLLGLLSIHQNLWELKEKIERHKTEYQYLRYYALEGAEDPSRNSRYELIKQSLLIITDELQRAILKKESSTLYYNTLRYEELYGGISCAAIIKEYNLLKQNLKDVNQGEYEKLLSKIFNCIWINFPMSSEDKDAIDELIYNSSTDKCLMHLVSYGSFLSLIQFYDITKIKLLATIYQSSPDREIRIISLICLLLICWVYKNRSDSQIDDLFSDLKLNHDFAGDVKSILYGLLKTGDTERITKKMNDDIIPALSKLKPDIEKRMRENNIEIDGDFSEFNPEWENIIEEAGIADKLRELTELQSQGNDLLMVTFSHLKSFPFFNEISNWFRPFTRTHSELKKGSTYEIISNILSDSNFFCESDKFSMILSFAGIPENQLKMITDQLKIQTKEMTEIMKSNLDSDKIERDLFVTKTLQNLYRFFKLFRRKNEFNDPFSSFIILSELDILSDIIGDEISKKNVANFFFQREYYAIAANLYESLIDEGVRENEMYQKAAYCYQKIGDIEKALKLYEVSDLINSDNLWNLRRLGFCAKTLGKTNEALNYYNRILAQVPDDISATLNCGYCLMELKKYDEAIKMFYKVDFLQNGSLKALRPLAWCFLVIGDYEKSKKIYAGIMEQNYNQDDLLNLGHLNMIGKDYKSAIKYYSEAFSNDKEKFMTEIGKDKEVLFKAGVEPLMLNIVIESVR